MAVAVLTNAHVYTGGVDLGGYSNTVTLDADVEDLDSTVFNGNGWRSREAGLAAVSSVVEGFFDATVDASLFTAFGTTDVPYSVVPSAAAVGDVAYCTKV